MEIGRAQPQHNPLAGGSNAAAFGEKYARLAGKQTWLVLGILLLTVAVIHLLTLMRLPDPYVDEGWNANRSLAFLQTGQAFGTMDSGVFDKHDGYWTYFPLLGTFLHAAAIAIFGPTLFAMRLVSLLFGLMLMFAMYLIASRLYTSQTGLLTAALTSISLPFIFSSHLGRHDIIIAALGFCAIALYFSDNSNGFSLRSLVSGLLISLSMDIHLNSVIYFPVLVVLYLWDYRLGLLKARRFWGFLLGFGAGVAYFAIVHIIPYPQTFFTLFNIGNGSGRTPTLLTLNPSVWLASVVRTSDMLGLYTLIALGSVVILLRRRTDSDKRVLVLCAALFLTFLLVLRGKPYFYYILVFPIVSLLAAIFVEGMSTLPWRGSPLAYARTLLVSLLVAIPVVAGVMTLLNNDSRADYEAAISTVRQAIPEGSTVMSPQVYWFAAPQERFLSWEQLIYYRRYSNGSSLEEAFRAMRPDYFIIDEFLTGAIIDESAWPKDKPLPFLYIPKADLDEVLAEHGSIAGRVLTRRYGDVRIYKLTWN